MTTISSSQTPRTYSIYTDLLRSSRQGPAMEKILRSVEITDALELIAAFCNDKARKLVRSQGEDGEFEANLNNEVANQIHKLVDSIREEGYLD